MNERHAMKCGEELALPLKGVRSQPEGVAFIDLLEPCALFFASNDHFKAVRLLSQGVSAMHGSGAIRLGQNHVAPHLA